MHQKTEHSKRRPCMQNRQYLYLKQSDSSAVDQNGFNFRRTVETGTVDDDDIRVLALFNR